MPDINKQYISMFWPCFWLFMIFLYMPESNIINIYTKQCDLNDKFEKVKLKDCTKPTIYKSQYKVSFDTQTVVGKTSPSFRVNYENCIVFNKKNWSCSTENSKIGVTKGFYYEDLDSGQGIYWTGSNFNFYYHQEISNFFRAITGNLN